ncbi:MAG: hypothetical protein A2Y07_08235 [Planctomycetes bacterium GWF2_50_10]|nr:MAG: hypothetical protein A2Y07_08235 [Planctomycetes bacterium GWF2_50_10]
MNSSMRKAVFFVVLMGIAYVSWAYMIKPVNANLDKQKAQLEAQMLKLSELEKATLAMRDLDNQMTELKNAVEFFNSKLPPTSQVHKVLEQVTVIAQKEGLKTKVVRTMPQKNWNNYVEQPLKMELQGNFDSFYSFLLELEQMARITRIRDMQLKKDPKNEGVAIAEFTVSIFFQDNKQVASQS